MLFPFFRFISKPVCSHLNRSGTENTLIFVKRMSVCPLHRNTTTNTVDLVECVVLESSSDAKIYSSKSSTEILWCFYYKDFDCLLMYLSYLKYFQFLGGVLRSERLYKRSTTKEIRDNTRSGSLESKNILSRTKIHFGLTKIHFGLIFLIEQLTVSTTCCNNVRTFIATC